MNGWALVALSVMLNTEGCDRTPGAQTTPAAQQTAVPGSPPGAFMPSVCMGYDDLRAWRRVDPATVTEDAHQGARGSQCRWSVVMRNGIPIVFAAAQNRDALPPGLSPDESFKPASAAQRGGAGVLIGFNGGEWGGSLRWRTKGGAPDQVLLNANVVAILPASAHFLALTFLGHGSQGRAVEIRDEAGRFEIGRTAELPGAPAAGHIDKDGSVLIATGKGLLRLSREFQIHPLLEENWWRLHPVSLAMAKNETVYVGMRGVVVEVQLSTKPPRQIWLYPF